MLKLRNASYSGNTFAERIDCAISHLRDRLVNSSTAKNKPSLDNLNDNEREELEMMRVYQSLRAIKEKIE